MSGHFTDDEMSLQELVAQKIKESGTTDLEYFKSCYYRAYLKYYNCIRDVQSWRDIGAVPVYVAKYV